MNTDDQFYLDQGALSDVIDMAGSRGDFEYEMKARELIGRSRKHQSEWRSGVPLDTSLMEEVDNFLTGKWKPESVVSKGENQ